mgnify:FL=1
MKPEVIILKEEKDKKVIIEDVDELLKIFNKFYAAGYQDGRESNITITTPSSQSGQSYGSGTAVPDWSQKIIYTTASNDSKN